MKSCKTHSEYFICGNPVHVVIYDLQQRLAIYVCLLACLLVRETPSRACMYVGKHKPDASIDSVIISPRPSRM